MAGTFGVVSRCSLLPQCSGSRAEVNGSFAQAGNVTAEQRPEEEVHSRWHIDKQKGKRWHVLRPEKIQFQTVFGNTQSLDAEIQFQAFQR
jgi:hypothetical protein